MHLLGKIKQFEGVRELRGDPFKVDTVEHKISVAWILLCRVNIVVSQLSD